MARLAFPISQPQERQAISAAAEAGLGELRDRMRYIEVQGPANDKRHPITGCRADTLFGVWLYPPDQLIPLIEGAWAIMEGGELHIHMERSEQMRRERDAKPPFEIDAQGIGYLKLEGPLTKHETSLMSAFGGTSMLRFRELLHMARAEQRAGKLKALFVDADSNGGTAEGAAETASAIRRTAELMPVVFHAEDKANSGCLWFATQGSRFTAGRGATVGSQGTIAMLIDRSENFKRQGIRPVVISTGPYKGIGSPGTEITPEHEKVLQKWVDQVNGPFRDDVIEARRLTAEQAEEVGQAGVHVGADALRVGLIDAVCSRDEAIEHLRGFISGDFLPPPVGAPSSGGAPPAPTPSPAASQRISTMTTPATGASAIFTAVLMARINKIPGLETVTPDTAAEQLTTRCEALDRDLSTRTTERDNATARANQAEARAPKAPDPELVRARASGARARIETLSLKQTINAGMRTHLDAMIGKPGEEVAANLTGPEGGTVAELVLKTFEAAPKIEEKKPETGERDRRVLIDPKMENQDPASAGKKQGESYVEQRAREMGTADKK